MLLDEKVMVLKRVLVVSIAWEWILIKNNRVGVVSGISKIFKIFIFSDRKKFCDAAMICLKNPSKAHSLANNREPYGNQWFCSSDRTCYSAI